MASDKGPPERIWLQWYGDSDESEWWTEGEDPRHEDVCWCEDKVFDSDVEYVRVDQLRTARAEALADIHSRFMDQAEIQEAKSISGSELPSGHEMFARLKGIVWDMLREAEQASAGGEDEDG